MIRNPGFKVGALLVAALAGGPAAAPALAQDVGDVAVIPDNGLIVTRRNPFDLGGLTVRFDPAGDDLFSVASWPGAVDPDYGPALTFGYPGATEFPGDDDTQEVPFPAGFPFFGTTYTSVWVNTDGNVTLGAPEFASNDRDKTKHVSGPARISAYLFDVNAFNAFNPAGTGTIHAALKADPDRLVVTWNQVGDFAGSETSTFQITLFATGSAEITIDHIDPAATSGVTGIARGGGLGPIRQVDLGAGPPLLYEAGALLEAFSPMATANYQQLGREFYRTHPDSFDFLAVFTDFSTGEPFIQNHEVSNQTRGIGTRLNPDNGQPEHPTVFDYSAAHGSAGELESIVFLNNIFYYWPDAARMVNPPVEAYTPGANNVERFDYFGMPVSLDGQPTAQVRAFGVLPPDDGELSQYYPHAGAPFSNYVMSAMAMMAHEVAHRWCGSVRFLHPAGYDDFQNYDLLGRDIQHWSFFMNTAVPAGQFAGAPRSSVLEGNAIVDLGRPDTYLGTPTNLGPGESLFLIPPDELQDGYSALDQHLMGLVRSKDAGRFFYVDQPTSIFTGQTLDAFNPDNPLDTTVTMRGWATRGGMAFKGKRVDLSVKNLQDYEKIREKTDNPTGARFWGPKGRLAVRYFSATGRADPAGDATVLLTTADRELGDEADMIDAAGRPVDVKTMAFVLLTLDGATPEAVERVDEFRRTWQTYANGPATGGRGHFDTLLNPAIH